MNFCGIPLCQIRAIQADFIHMLYDLRFEENFKKKITLPCGSRAHFVGSRDNAASLRMLRTGRTEARKMLQWPTYLDSTPSFPQIPHSALA
jgi:hypothetical protein